MGKAIKFHNKKTGELLYPMTASDMVFDPTTKKSVKADLAEKIGDAPSDGKQYARQDGLWVEVEAGAVSETALINVLPGNESLYGASVKVTTSEGDTLLDSTWQGELLSVQIRAGLQYTVTVGSVDGFITPEAVTYTAIKGGTRSVSMTYIASRLQVNIMSNQDNDATIAAVKATVKYGSTSVEVANGGYVNLPLNVDVTITFPAVDGYKAPDAITYSHTSGDYAKGGTYETEIVKVTLSADDSSSVSGQIVTINGVAHTYGSTAVEQKVPFGTEYTVSVDDKSGYTTPASQTFTASQSVRNLALVYSAITMGIYIQDIDGKLYSESEWDGTKTANGIAVITENCSFVVAKEFTSDKYTLGVFDSKPLPGTYAQTVEEGLQLFDGKSNTEAMYAEDPTYYKAAAACHETIFGNGLNGYLPALGEFGIVINNFNKIIALLDKIGSNFREIWEPTIGNYFWGTSTGGETNSFWFVEFDGEYNSIFATTGSKSTETPLLICSPFVSPNDYIEFTINSTIYKAVRGTTWGNWCSSQLNNGGYSISSSGVVDDSSGKYSVGYYDSSNNWISSKKDVAIIKGQAYREG